MTDEHELRRRQRALAEFGDFVLDHDNLDDILNEACRLIAQALLVDLAKVVEIDRRMATGLVRAGVGWRGWRAQNFHHGSGHRSGYRRASRWFQW